MGKKWFWQRAARTALTVGLVGFSPTAVAASECGPDLWAGRLDDFNRYDYSPWGPDAIGGIGDFGLSNGRLCAVVSDIDHDNELSERGGILVDLAHCDKGNDQLLGYQELLNFDPTMSVSGDKILTQSDSTSASILVQGGYGPFAVETTYRLDLFRPNRLQISTIITRRGEEGALVAVAGGMNNIESLTPFTLSFDRKRRSPGFLHRQFVGKGPSELSKAATPADLVVAVGARGLNADISYGQRVVSAKLIRSNGRQRTLPHFFFSDEMATTLNFFSRPFWFGRSKSLSWFEWMQAQRMDLKEGEAIQIEQEIWVGTRSDVASVTNMIFADRPELSGQIDNSHAVVHLDRSNGEAFSQSLVDSKGRFSFRAPAGKYQLRILAPGGLEEVRPITLDAKGLDLGSLALAPRARVLLPQGAPMRLVFVGQNDTPDPDFSDDLLGFLVLDGHETKSKPKSRDISLMGLKSDPAFVVLEPGSYKVFATRGPEYSVQETDLQIGAGGDVRLDISVPERLIETPEWISADLHIHASPSFDNSLPVDERIRSFVAQGGEVMVSTEHDFIYDYTNDIERLGATDLMKTITGVEITSEAMTQVAPYTIGHGNAFPFAVKPNAFKNGAPISEGRRWRDIIGELHGGGADPVIQLNHARTSKVPVDGEDDFHTQAYFSHLGSAGVGFDPDAPLSEGANAVLVEKDLQTGYRDVDFDAIELMNGPSMVSYAKLRADWFSLLRQGVRMTGTANSDSHIAAQIVAAPRTMVRVGDDRLSGFSEEVFLEAVRGGKAYGTTGPLIDVRLGDAGIGDQFSGTQGDLRVTILPSSWVNVSELRIYVNGVEVMTKDIDSVSPVETQLEFTQDSFITVEVEGPASAAFEAVLPGFVPFAFSNPIFVDADGDDQWTPPGL